MSSRWTAFFIWMLAAACAASWGVKIFAATRPVPPAAVPPQAAVVAQGPMTRLFGAAPTPDEVADQAPPESDRFQLVGVIAPRSGATGALALVSVDGQPAKAWRVGAAVDGDTTLLSVARRSADFGPAGGPSAFTLQLPEPAAAQTGTLPVAAPQPVVAAPVRGAPMARGGMPGVPNPVAFPVRPGVNMRGGALPQAMRPAPATPGDDSDVEQAGQDGQKDE